MKPVTAEPVAPPDPGLWHYVKLVLKPIASLQLTVVLFTLAIGLIFFGTVAQMDYGIWTVVDKYFWSWGVLVPFDLFAKIGIVFFDLPKDTHWSGAFPFPGGKLLGLAMLINLLAAHLVRFKISWKRSGILLIHGGLILLFVGEFITREYAVEQRMMIDEGSSTNFTEDSWAREENNIVQVASPELCTYYETDFDELWTSGDIATTGARDHGAVSVGPASIEVAFAPGEGRAIDHEIAHYIGMARRRLKVCSMIITSGAILGALCDALSHGRVADYGGVYDRTQMQSVFDQWRGTPSEWKIHAFHQVAGPLSGKVSTPFQPGSPHDFMHNKIVVADDRVITGSYNLSNSATVNAENVLMIRDADLADPYCAYIDRLAERYRS